MMILIIFYVLLEIYGFILLARVLISWVQLDPYHPVVRFLHDATEPVLRPVRELLPPMGGFDLSPMVVFIAIQLLAGILRAMAS
jgi:YggT family protein